MGYTYVLYNRNAILIKFLHLKTIQNKKTILKNAIAKVKLRSQTVRKIIFEIKVKNWQKEAEKDKNTMESGFFKDLSILRP